ncbi:BadF/BadG/BcrA/BcrD ATPase family protein [Sulfuracidifex metallicus]|uniref:BadF/BadG/BcrA/BcrD ATPase family protein n=1 Tax=Sulfuracidifex metallicus TaxID=47303 RepID=UPI0022740840|nr:BadF/BadG/BcrA/BcrD ATPase family protein [Sulfuracidifex metallicus]MCY0850729.1 ATPase [Sulfuracidifex metallicus]
MILVGVDGGGTTTEAIAYDTETKKITSAECGPGNFHNVGLAEAVTNVITAIRRATGGKIPDLVYVGLAGMDSRYDYEIMKVELKDAGKKTVVDHDGFVALYGETKGKPGIIVISGTGSVIVGYDGKSKLRYGGLGWLLSDEGSAYQIGRDLLRTIVKMMDGRLPKTSILEKALQFMGAKDVDDLVKWSYHEGHRVKEIASLARVVHESAKEGDETANAILKRNAEELAMSSSQMSKRLGVNTVYLKGGMFDSCIYFNFFRSYLENCNVRTVRSRVNAAFGALLLAAREASMTLNIEEVND